MERTNLLWYARIGTGIIIVIILVAVLLQRPQTPQMPYDGCIQANTTTDCAELARLQAAQTPATSSAPVTLSEPLWMTFTDHDVGISFSYPSTDPEGQKWHVMHGDSGWGLNAMIDLPSGAHIYISSNTQDYGVPKDGFVSGSEGYVEKNSKAYVTKGIAQPEWAFAPDEWWTLSDGNKAAIIYGKNYDPHADYPEPAVIAMVNLPGPDYHGIGLELMNVNDQGPHPASPEDLETFRRIVTSIHPVATLPPWSEACTHQDSGMYSMMCRPNELTALLEKRAKTPYYRTYTDEATGISFEYPSSISAVFTSINSGQPQGAIGIGPLIPAEMGTEYWIGIMIKTTPCGESCDDLGAYLREENRRASAPKSFELTITKETLAGREWTKAYLFGAMGESYATYVTKDKDRIISITTDAADTNGMTELPHISAAFRHILETLTF